MACIGAAVFGLVSTTAVASASANITEAGSSLVYPLVSVWASHYSGVSAAAGGSGKGIQLIQQGGVDIGASDAPMTSVQYHGDTFGTPVQIPWALTGTGVGYNIHGVGYGLHLTGSILAKIYTGKITKWGSSAIVRINKHYARALRRAGKITPVFRSDGSGDSYVFQHFLTRAAGSVWHVGYSTAWGGSTGIGENGNAGIAGVVRQNRGTVGYLSAAYLIQQHIHTAQIRNAAGRYEYPNAPNIADAARSNHHITGQGASFTGVSIVYPSRRYKTAYPVSTYSYAIVNRNDSHRSQVQAFLTWVVSSTGGQRYGGNLDFLPLPSAIRSADDGLIGGL